MPEKRYDGGAMIFGLCKITNLEPRKIIARAGMTVSVSELETLRVSATEFNALFSAVINEYANDDFCISTSDTLVNIPYYPECYSFMVAKNATTGLARISPYKVYIAPIIWRVVETPDTVELHLLANSKNDAVPPLLAALSFITTTKLIRSLTGVHITPKAVHIAHGFAGFDQCETAFGCEIATASENKLILHRHDAELPFITSNPRLQSLTEDALIERYGAVHSTHHTVMLVTSALKDLLPVRAANSESVANLLGMSKRTFERRLKDDGTNFRTVLTDTRRDLAERYLQQGRALSEVAKLVGYSELSAFLRAFKAWHGCAPREYLRHK